MSKKTSIDNSEHIPLYVGYKALEERLGINERTIQRMVKSKKFPAATDLSPNRVGWNVETVKNWLKEREHGLTADAMSNPDDLEPDELIDKMSELAAAVVAKRDGEEIDPETMDVQFKVTRQVTQDQFEAAEKREFALLAERFASLNETRSFLLAAWIFPGIRQLMESADELAKELLNDPERLAEFAACALHDDDWADFQARLKERN